jgi:hypothetical protein
MRILGKIWTAARLAAAVAGVWLCAVGPASAGGSADIQTLNTALLNLCTALGTSLVPSCPQVPTVTQAVLELAALNDNAPERVRAFNNVPQGEAVDAGNPGRWSVTVDSQISGLPVKGSDVLNLLSTLRPLAFVSSTKKGQAAKAVQLYDTSADTFLYAVASGPNAGFSPDAVFLFYDDTSRTNTNLPKGQVIAQFSFPLAVLIPPTDPAAIPTTESPVFPVTLQFKVPQSGANDCSASVLVGSFPGRATPPSPADLGIQCAVVFAPSPASAHQHAIFQLQLPLLVTKGTDPLYFAGINPSSPNLGNPAFVFDSFIDLGVSIGLPPYAAPLGPPTTPSTYSLCASLPGGNGNGQSPVSAVAAFYVVAPDGETMVSAPLAPPPGSLGCPF